EKSSLGLNQYPISFYFYNTRFPPLLQSSNYSTGFSLYLIVMISNLIFFNWGFSVCGLLQFGFQYKKNPTIYLLGYVICRTQSLSLWNS
ncbi:hypothetical protein GIB67_031779, partial [Kingdonia uniflora]